MRLLRYIIPALFIGGIAWAANGPTPIPNLPPATLPLSGNEFIPLQQNNKTVQTLIGNVKGTPGGTNGSLQYNNNTQFGGYGIGAGLAIVGNSLVSTSSGGGANPSGLAGSVQINGGSGLFSSIPNGGHAYQYIGSDGNTASFMTPASLIDPRTYGAACVGSGSTGSIASIAVTNAGSGYTNGTYTSVPLTGGSGAGAVATIVVASGSITSASVTSAGAGYKLRDQLSASGLGSGTGLVMQVVSFNANKLPVYDGVHDDTAAFQAALYAAQNTGQGVLVPDGCWVSPTNNALKIPQGVVMVGQGWAPTYSYDMLGSTAASQPILYIIGHPSYALQLGANPNDGFVGFQINASADGQAYTNTICIGTATNSGGGSPPFWIKDMSPKGCFAAVGGFDLNTTFFLHSDHNDYSANAWGIYGHFSDLDSLADTFASEGNYGIFLSGFGGEARINQARFEFSGGGIYAYQYGGIQIDNSQCDHTSVTCLLIGTLSNGITISNMSMAASGTGNTSGAEAHITLSRTTSAPVNLHLSNVTFSTGGTNFPKYAMEFTTSGSFNDNIEITGGDTSVGYTKDFFNFQNGRPPHMSVDMLNVPVQGKNANGNYPGQVRGIPSNQWTAHYVVGDTYSYNEQFTPLVNGYGAQLSKQLGTAPLYYIINDFNHYDCDIIDQQLVPNVTPTSSSNPLVTILPSLNDIAFGGGFYQSHLADTNVCMTGGLTWAAVPQENKIFGQQFTATGSWTNNTHYANVYGVTSNTQNDSLSTTITTNGGPIYLWSLMHGNDGGAFTWTLDGTTTGTVATQGTNSFAFPIAGKFSMAGTRIPVTSSGGHTLNIAITSTTTVGNTVTIEGVGTPPGLPSSNKPPVVLLGGQLPTTNSSLVVAADAFNTSQFTLSTQLLADGLQVGFADVRKYWNALTDSTTLSGNPHTTSTGQAHIAQAFGGIAQAIRNSGNMINPLDFGASCNTQYFAVGYADSGHLFNVSTTKGSADISIARYTFQPGVATQYGGGDVGKRVCIMGAGDNSPIPGGYDVGPCTYVSSVNTTTNKATLGRAMWATTTFSYGMMGGYPANPNDPSTAQDDTVFIQNAANASIYGGGKVFLPNNCMVHNLTLPQNIIVEGNAPGDFYLQTAQNADGPPPQATVLNCGITDYPTDNTVCIQSIPHTRLKNFMLRCNAFPYTPWHLTGTGFGYSTNSHSFPGAQMLTENMTYFGCPTGVGQAYGYNYQVNLNGSIADNGDGTSTMTVLSITSTNFKAADNWSNEDFLALGRTISGPGVTSGTVISSVTSAPGGWVGTYILNKAMNVTATNLISPVVGPSSMDMEIRDRFSQFNVFGMAYNGQFSDSEITGSICSGTFSNNCMRLGPVMWHDYGCSVRWHGGRMEEMATSAVTADGCGFVADGTEFQFNGGYNIHTLGTGSNVQLTGGYLEGGGHCYANDNQKTSIMLGGSAPYVVLDGVGLAPFDFGTGCTQGGNSYLFSTDTGASGIQATVAGGSGFFQGAMMTKLYNASNGTPGKYKQDVAGWPKINTFNSITRGGSLSLVSTSVVGGADYWTAIAGATVGSSGTVTMTGMKPLTDTASTLSTYDCQAGDITTPSSFVLSGTTSTSCTLSLTTTVNSGDTVWGKAIQGN